MIIKVEVELASINISIDGLLHLCVRRKNLIGIQSYKNGHKSYVIEYEYKSKTITTEYDKSEVWETILKELGRHTLF